MRKNANPPANGMVANIKREKQFMNGVRFQAYDFISPNRTQRR